MKLTFTTLIALLGIFLGINGQNFKTNSPTFSFGDSATIILRAINNPSQLKFVFQPSYIFPIWSKSPNDIVVEKNGQTAFNFTVEHPTQFILQLLYSSGKSMYPLRINGLILPKDSLFITIDFTNLLIPITLFSGISSTFCNYYQALLSNKAVINMLSKTYSLPGKLLYPAFVKVDSLVLTQLHFFEDYIKSNQLPKWFIDYERENIHYSGAETKLAHIRYNNTFNAKKAYISPDVLISIREAKIDNPIALQNSSYYRFLSMYFDLLAQPTSTSSLKEFKVSTFIKSIPDIESELKSPVRDYYFSSSISRFYNDINLISRIDSVQSIIQSLYINKDTYLFFNKKRNELLQKLIQETENNACKTGKKAPDFILNDTSGRRYSLSQFNTKPVCLLFWTTKSMVSIRAIDSLNRIFSRPENKNMVLMHICTDPFADSWKNVVKTTKGPGLHLIGKGNWIKELFEDYGITEFPFIATIDDWGILTSRKPLAVNEIEKTIQKFISQNTSIQ